RHFRVYLTETTPARRSSEGKCGASQTWLNLMFYAARRSRQGGPCKCWGGFTPSGAGRAVSTSAPPTPLGGICRFSLGLGSPGRPAGWRRPWVDLATQAEQKEPGTERSSCAGVTRVREANPLEISRVGA